VRLSLEIWRRELGVYSEILDRVIHASRRRGERLAMVGGGVRDVLIDRGIRDLDLVIEGDAHALARALERDHGGKAQLYSSFGTAEWSLGDLSVDLATARTETYAQPGALPQVRASGLEEDLRRRDFSINAMAVVLGTEAPTVLDLQGGLEDLESRQLRVLHPRSFLDDPTRIWRALRFAVRLDFGLAPETEALLKDALDAHCLESVTLQRQGAELDRALAESQRGELIRLASDWDLWRSLSPSLTLASLGELSEVGTEAGSSALAWLVLGSALPPSERKRLVDLVPGGGECQRQWIRADGAVREAEKSPLLASSQSPRSQVARVLEALSAEDLDLLSQRSGSESRAWLKWWKQEGRGIQSGVDGHQLQSLGFEPGPAIGRAKSAALDAARDGASADEQLADACAVDRD